MAEIPLSVSCKTAMQVASEVSYKGGESCWGDSTRPRKSQ